MLKAPSIQAKDTFALVSPVCSIPVRAFLSYGTSPFIIEVYIIEEVLTLYPSPKSLP